MDKIITRIPKLKALQMKAYNYELTKNSKEDVLSLNNDLNNDRLNGLYDSNESKKTTESDELSFVDANQEKSVQKEAINISKPLLIENYAEVLIQKLLEQKLKLLNSNESNLPYYYHGGT
ncbi:MAG: hypothetical protein P0116_07845 [Candidatus Nitrosocosmicus sp.]|nr:hypothetical protein [Candidatus Nitrosocosmicus sp.]